VTVRIANLPRPNGRAVTLSSTMGRLSPPAVVRLDDQGVAAATLRSSSVGRATIAASAAGAVSDAKPIDFAWPVVFLASALLGGALGSLVKTGGAKTGARRSAGRAGTAWIWTRRILLGALTGLIVAVLYVLGVNVLPVPLSATMSEALVFAVAVLGAVFGLRPLLARLEGK